MHFLVAEGGVISCKEFELPTTRNEYYEFIAYDWHQSVENLLVAMNQCEPLALKVHALYSRNRDELIASLEEESSKLFPDKKLISNLKRRLKHLPEEPYEGVDHWLSNVDQNDFDKRIAPEIKEWFASEPNWANESEYVQEQSSSQGAAYLYFRDLEFGTLKRLGVSVIEGEFPGSSYCAAELRGTIDEANTQAHELNLDIVFEKNEHGR